MISFLYSGVVLSPKFLLASYENAQDLIENVVQEMDTDVLIDGNTKLMFYDSENLRITKGLCVSFTIYHIYLVLMKKKYAY